MNLVQGIKNIELIPTLGDSIDITPRLARLLDESHTIRASIAFWTFSFRKLTEYFGAKGVNSFQSPDSFLCVDIQEPTSIDSLATLDQSNVNVHLNLRRLHPALKKLTSSTGLLHTKVIVADRNDGDAEIWIGSHNWTQFALKGPNTEASLSITCDRLSPFYSEMTSFLQDIRNNICDPFDNTMVQIYKQIQADLAGKSVGETVTIIDIESENAHLIGVESVLIFGTDMEDYESLDKIGRKIVFRIYDSRNGEQFLYHGRIIQTGQMESHNYNATGISFTDIRRYAFCTNRRIPKLQPPQHVPLHIMQQSMYFVTLQLEEREYRTVTISEYTRSQKTNWIDEDFDPIYDRMPSDNSGKSLYSNVAPSLEKSPRIQIPFFKRENEVPATGRKQYYLELPLEEKRERTEYRLIRKAKIIYE